MELAERGGIKTPISQRYRLDQAAEALKALDSPERLGKAIIQIH
ncbi:zinc-binding dehydrogenase [Pyrobaculum sp.]